jgi:hypothetical protein
MNVYADLVWEHVLRSYSAECVWYWIDFIVFYWFYYPAVMNSTHQVELEMELVLLPCQCCMHVESHFLNFIFQPFRRDIFSVYHYDSRQFATLHFLKCESTRISLKRTYFSSRKIFYKYFCVRYITIISIPNFVYWHLPTLLDLNRINKLSFLFKK